MYQFKNLQEFISLFLFILDAIRSPDDFHLIFNSLRKYLEENQIHYAEVFLAPSRMISNGLDFHEIAETIDSLASECVRTGGPEVKYLIDVSRTFGSENASKNLQRILKLKTTNIIGIGLGGAELMGPARDFKDVFAQARSEGLRCVTHAGKDVIGFGAGEPDFDTPEHIKEAARVAIAKGLTKYTPVGGTLSLKKAVAQKLERDNLLSYELNEITTSNGGKQCIYNAFMACLNKGDEVILPVPCWVSYPDQLKLAEARAVSVFCGVEQNYLMTAEQLEAAITPQTKMLIINSPCNPSGAAYTKEALISLGEVLKKHPNILILTDDIYEHIRYDNFNFYTIIYKDYFKINFLFNC